MLYHDGCCRGSGHVDRTSFSATRSSPCGQACCPLEPRPKLSLSAAAVCQHQTHRKITAGKMRRQPRNFERKLTGSTQESVFPGQTGTPFHLKNWLTFYLDLIGNHCDDLNQRTQLTPSIHSMRTVCFFFIKTIGRSLYCF